MGEHEESVDAVPEKRSAWAWRRLSRRERLKALGVSAALLAVFVFARWLEPDPAGLGTHEQLGLRTCRMISLFGIPCAFCGMTTAFALMVRGDIVGGFLTQPAGALLFVSGVLALCVVGALAVTGRVHARMRVPRIRARFALVCVAILVLAWGYKIAATVIT